MIIMAYDKCIPCLCKLYDGTMPLTLQESLITGNVLTPVPFDINIFLPMNKDRMNYIFRVNRCTLEDMILNKDIDNGQKNRIKNNKTVVDDTRYIIGDFIYMKVSDVVYDYRIDYRNNRKLFVSSSIRPSFLRNPRVLSTEKLMRISVYVYKNILSRRDSSDGIKYGRIANHDNIPLDIDSLLVFYNKIFFTNEEEKDIHNIYEFIRYRNTVKIKNKGGRLVDCNGIIDLSHLLGIFTIFYMLRDFCFSDILEVDIELLSKIEYFINMIDVALTDECLMLENLGVDLSCYKYSEYSKLLNEKLPGKISVMCIIPDLITLLNDIYYGEWLTTEDNILYNFVCEPTQTFTPFDDDMISLDGKSVNLKNRITGIPIGMSVTVISYENQVIEGELMDFVNKVAKLVDNLEFILGITSDSDLTNSDFVMNSSYSSLMSTILPALKEHNEIIDFILKNPSVKLDGIFVSLLHNNSSKLLKYYLNMIESSIFGYQNSLKNSVVDNKKGQIDSYAVDMAYKCILNGFPRLDNVTTEMRMSFLLQSNIEKFIFSIEKLKVSYIDLLYLKKSNARNELDIFICRDVLLDVLDYNSYSIISSNTPVTSITVDCNIDKLEYMVNFYKSIQVIRSNWLSTNESYPSYNLNDIFYLSNNPHMILKNVIYNDNVIVFNPYEYLKYFKYIVDIRIKYPELVKNMTYMDDSGNLLLNEFSDGMVLNTNGCFDYLVDILNSLKFLAVYYSQIPLPQYKPKNNEDTASICLDKSYLDDNYSQDNYQMTDKEVKVRKIVLDYINKIKSVYKNDYVCYSNDEFVNAIQKIPNNGNGFYVDDYRVKYIDINNDIKYGKVVNLVELYNMCDIKVPNINVYNTYGSKIGVSDKDKYGYNMFSIMEKTKSFNEDKISLYEPVRKDTVVINEWITSVNNRLNSYCPKYRINQMSVSVIPKIETNVKYIKVDNQNVDIKPFYRNIISNEFIDKTVLYYDFNTEQYINYDLFQKTSDLSLHECLELYNESINKLCEIDLDKYQYCKNIYIEDNIHWGISSFKFDINIPIVIFHGLSTSQKYNPDDYNYKAMEKASSTLNIGFKSKETGKMGDLLRKAEISNSEMMQDDIFLNNRNKDINALSWGDDLK